jgi:uncharacterized membrane protein (DUF485 family)
MLHEPAPKEPGVDYASKKKSRLGIILFLVYAIVYGIFVIICLNYTHILGKRLFGGLNMAVVYGMGLIVLAAVMGFVYSWICTIMEDKMNKEVGR